MTQTKIFYAVVVLDNV